MDVRNISQQTIWRLPVYLRFLQTQNSPYVSATAIADVFGLNEVQVRKDLSSVSVSKGRSGVGYHTQTLIADIQRLLGCDQKRLAVLVGAGNLGRAMLGYSGFDGCGMRICAAFDQSPSLIGSDISGVRIYPSGQIESFCRMMKVEIGIITVPGPQAQSVCTQLLEGGIKAIWNFAPVHLSVPEGTLLHNENLAASTTVLTKSLMRHPE